LRKLLGELGFEPRNSAEPKCLVFEHPIAKTRLLLPSNRDDEDARLADVVSIRTHLLYRGHVDEDAFEYFIEHGHLQAS